MRNPWGQNEWTGEWSDKDPKWNDMNLRKMLAHEDLGNDGIFFILWEDFKKYFSDFQMCYYHDDYNYSAIKIRNDAQ